MQTIINWIPGAPDNPVHGKTYFVEHEDGSVDTREYESTFDLYFLGRSGMAARLIKSHAPYEPPKAERTNTAREIIEAEIGEAETKGWREANYLDGLRFAIECLDKPAEPMVSVEKVRRMYELAMYDANTDEDFHKYFLQMLEQEGKQ